MPPFIIIADDHSMIRKGIKLLISSKLGHKDIIEADSCNAVMNELKKGGCTHIILDVIFADGTSLEIVPIIRKLYPQVKIMIFSMQPAEIYSEVFKLYDIYYYLPKSSPEAHTLSSIKSFLDNEPMKINTGSSAQKGNNPFSLLAPRELEILHYLLNGFQTKQIANTLNLGDSTVSTFKKRIFEKTGAQNLANLYEIASLHNLSFYAQAPKTKSE